MILKLINKISKKEYILENLTDNKTSNMFYNIDIQLPEDIEIGEYQYELTDNNAVVSCGLVQVGDYKPEKQQYNKQEKEYVIYGE